MPIPFQCPHCGLRTQVAEELAGQSGPCRQCGQTVTVPSPLAPLGQAIQAHGGYGLSCPRCGSQSIVAGSWPWYLGTIGAIFVSARFCTQCHHEFDARKPTADFRKRKLRLALLINGFGALGILLVVFLVGLVVYTTSR